MIKLTDTEENAIIRRTAAAIGELQEGEDAISVLSRIYCQNLPDKSPRQGDLMARELVSWMNRFRQSMADAEGDPEAYLYRFLQEQIAPLPLDRQCRFLRQQILACGELEHIRKMQDIPLTAETESDIQATEAERDALLKEAVHRLSGGDRRHDLEGILDQAAVDTFYSHSVTRAYVNEEMLQAITAMILYTMVKNGELSGLPEDTSLGQMAVGVCSEEAYREIVCAAEMGYLTESEVEQRMRSVRAVMAALLLAAAAAVAGSLFWTHSRKYGVVFYGGLGLLLLLWLSGVLGVWYRAAAEMVREEAERIADIPLELKRTENRTVRQETPARQNNVPRSEMELRREEEEILEQNKQYLGQ